MFEHVLRFWFEELSPEMWWKKDVALDATIADRFSQLHVQAKNGELYAWRKTASGSLAEIIVLDQFSRNIYRNTAEAFACDAQALVLAQFAIEKGLDLHLSQTERGFMYLPFMHSESKKIHELALDIYTHLGNQANLDFELQHKSIIERFGRYPHRNRILGRRSSDEELAFLKQDGSSF